ncbi:MAG: GTPase, partial [Bacilli bacterium]
TYGEIEHAAKRFMYFVGPTGVGKTTTIAKLAARAVMKEGKRVAFITTDTYRIAAIEQLKTYAQILNVPLEVCYTPDDLTRAKEKFAHFDSVFIDTAGRNFRNRAYVDDFQTMIGNDTSSHVYFVVSMTHKMRDIEAIIRNFDGVPVHQFIATKVDETTSFGPLVQLLVATGIGCAYITNGQNVPEDVRAASPATIIELLVGDFL